MVFSPSSVFLTSPGLRLGQINGQTRGRSQIQCSSNIFQTNELNLMKLGTRIHLDLTLMLSS
jgi:hypothetical protein